MKTFSSVANTISKTFQIIKRLVKTSSGKEIEFEYIERSEVALIIPIDSNNNVIILSQYRASINSFILEFPAGKRKSDESIEETAHRELREETGFAAHYIEPIGSFYTAPHFSDEKVYVFIAKDLNESEQKLEEEEIIDVKTLLYSDLLFLLKSNQILDSKTIVAVHFLTNKLYSHD